MIFIFPSGTLMGVDEVRLHLTEIFQEKIGLSQLNVNFSLLNTSWLAKPRNSNTSLPTSPCSNFTNHSSLSLFAIVKQCPAPTKPSTNRATPSLQVRVSRLLWRLLKVWQPRLSAFPSPPGIFFAQGSSPALRKPTQFWQLYSVRKCIRSAGLTPHPFRPRLQLGRAGLGCEGMFRWIKAMLLSPHWEWS